MDISDVNNSLESMALPAETKNAILQLIDIKINNDMKEFTAEVKQLENKLETTLQLIQGKLQMNQDKHSNEIKVVYWVVGIAMMIMLCVVGLMAKK
jgi:hypothetical protein